MNKILKRFLSLVLIFSIIFLCTSINVRADGEDEVEMVNLVLSDGTVMKYSGSDEVILVPSEYHNPDTYFRGMWITPLSGGVSLNTKADVDQVLDVMEYYNLNALIYHMRMFNDATYTSTNNPRSSYASGSSDEVIRYAIAECHKRGIEFHAWLNPYRCASSGITNITSITNKYASFSNNPAHDAKNLLMNSSGGVIMNPGLPEVRTFIVDTCMEIIEKFDVDAIHFDDYFYISGVDDTETQAKYNTENLSLGDFRRQQVDLFIKQLHDEMTKYNKEHNRYVQLGISPSGIYRNGDGIVTYDEDGKPITTGSKTGGMEHYGNYLYSDTLKWAVEEWIDYLLPQSYWGFSHRIAGYGDVMRWWDQCLINSKCKLYSGMGIYMAENAGSNYSWGFDPMEAANQILYATSLNKNEGTVFYVYQYLRDGYNGDTRSLYGQGLREIKTNMFTIPSILPVIETMELEQIESPKNIETTFTNSKTTISFDKVDNAKFYVVYRSKDIVTCSSDEVIAIFGADDVTGKVIYEDKNTNGEKYNYAVCAQAHTNNLSLPAFGNLVEYTVNFYGLNGEVISTQKVKSTESAVAPSAPVKSGADFVSWSKDFSYVTSDLDIYPRYTDSTFIVTFYDGDGKVLSTLNGTYKGTVTAPVCEKTGFTFMGWDTDFSSIENDLEIHPIFEVQMCKVTFLDYDESEILSYEIKYGRNLRYPPNPERRSYKFIGWDKDIDVVTGDVVLIAQYEPVYFTVTFVSGIDGSVIATKQVLQYGDVETIDAPVVNGYTFQRWQGALTNVVKDVTIKAIYDEICYNVTILDYDGKVIASFEYFLADGYTMPEMPEIEGKTFIGWDHDINNLGNDEIDVVIKPLYRDSNITIRFETIDGTLISEVKYSDELDYPEWPIIEGKTFTGWDKELTGILSSTTVTALYTTYYVTYLGLNDKIIEKKAVTEHELNYYPTPIDELGYKFDKWDKSLSGLTINSDVIVKALYKEVKCTVFYRDYNGNVIKEEEVSYGASASMDVGVPTVEGYEFIGFDNDGKNITSDININLVYKKIEKSGCNKTTIVNILSAISILGLVFVIRRKKF